MNNIILLRFHKNLKITQNRINLIRKFNPETEIHGLYGGNPNDYELFKNKLEGLTTLTALDKQSKEAKWKRSDLSILEWYLKTGQHLPFDHLYTIEYDLVILEKFGNLFSLPKNTIALTGLIKIKDIKENWYWLTDKKNKKESFQFLDLMKNTYKIKEIYACLGPGTVLTKIYLEEYSKIESHIPRIAHDELRLPQLATLFGIEMVDTGFYDNWNSKNPKTEKYFNCNEQEIPIKRLLKTYKKGFRKVFHPVYDIVPINKL